MKILQVNKFFYLRGGTERYLFTLSELLKKHGVEVIYFSQKNPKNFPSTEEKYFLSDLELGGFSWPTLLKLPRIFYSFEAKRKIKKIIVEQKPDLVHLHNIYHQISPSILPVIKKANLPLVMTVHDFKLIKPDYTLRADHKKIRPKNSRLVQALLATEFYWQKIRRVYEKNIDLFIVPSEFVKNQLIINGFAAQKIVVIPHPAGLNNFIVQPSQLEKYLFSFGRLDESKGLKTLIEAFALLTANNNYPDLQLKIAGTGPQEPELLKLAADYQLTERIKFLGQQDKAKLAELISGSLAVIVPSLVHETFGLAILESFINGKAVIASRVGALGEIIQVEENGLLFEAGNKNDLKDKINWLLNNPDKLAAMNLKAQVTALKYDPEKHFQQINQIYHKLIEKNEN